QLAPRQRHIVLAECTRRQKHIADIRPVLRQALAITEARGRCHLTDLGTSWLSDWLNCKGLPKDWADIRDVFLTARALGQHDMPLTRRKLLAKPDGLRMAILQNAYGIKLRQTPSLARMRAALAGIALKRAFGNKLAPGFSTDGGVDANSSRLLAGELARKPRDFETDGKLIAALAAEAVHAAQADVGTLRLTILRAYFSRAAGPTASEQPVTAPPRMAARTAKPPADGKAPHANATANPAKATTTGRPDLEAFATAVLAAGEARAQGWPGNRKVLIGHLWEEVAAHHADWGLCDVEFQNMLVEAHRTGHLVLANADLKSKSDLADFERSAITYKNTVWHFIRLDT
ncbi:MAG: hypothetical protein AAFO62_05175, partial [Pseudomonadota bacterium]